MAEVLVVDDEPKYAAVLKRVLEGEGHGCRTAAGPAEAIEAVKARAFDVLVSDIRMPGGDGVALARTVRELSPETELVLMTAYATVETAVAALRLGVRDYLLKPFANQDLIAAVNRLERVRRQRDENEHLRALRGPAEPLGRSPALLAARAAAERLAPAEAPVLIRGETGTGKEVFARFLHARSPRAAEPFLAINVAAIPRELVEAELFGFEAGAFTGADRARAGKLEAAGRGTLFLDEIGELPLELQAKLLRVLEQREFYRLGSVRARAFAARIVAATNRDLEAAVRSGAFRQDFYFRINVAELALPPLRERGEDIEALARSILGRHGGPDQGLSPGALAALSAYPWPGNIRELSNVIQRALLLAPGKVLEASDLALRDPAGLQKEPEAGGEAGAALREFPKHFDLGRWELSWVERALAVAKGVKTEAAKILGISRRQLDSRLRRIEAERNA